ncbi:MAG TPA: translocation/assembly module TamB domain-containing protein [Candidatus Krumholzibacteriaceae bacterium]
MNRKGTRRIRHLIGIAIALAIVLALFSAVFFGLRTDFFARVAGRLVSEHFLAGTTFSISADKVEGGMFGEVTFKGIKVHYRGRGEPFDIFRADEVSVTYDLVGLIGQPRRFKTVSLIKPILRLETDSTGAFVLPGAGGKKGSLPALEIGRFSLVDGQVIVRGRDYSEAFSRVNLAGSARSGGTEVHIAIEMGSTENGERGLILRRLKGKVAFLTDVKAKDAGAAPAMRIMLDSLAVALDESAFTASGLIVPSTRLFDLTVDVDPVEIGEITRILRIKTAHVGEIKGTITAKGRPEHFRFAGTMSGVLSGYALSDFRVNFLRDGNVIRLDSLGGVLNGAHVDGKGSYQLKTPNLLSLDLAVRGLDLSKGFAPKLKKKLPETRFNGAAELSYRVLDERLSFALDLGEGDYLGFPFTSGVAHGSYVNDTLTIEDAALASPTHTVSCRGTVAGGTAVSFVFNLECAARDTIFPYFKIKDYRGDARLAGKWEGTLGRWDLGMNGTCSNLVYYGSLVPEGEVKLAITKNSPRDSDYTVLFDLDGPGCRIGPVRFTGMSLSLAYQDRVTNIKRLVLSRDDLKVGASADVHLEGKGATVLVKECALEALGETWIGGGAFAVHVGDTAVRFDDIQFHSKAGAVFMDGAVGLKSKSVSGRFAFDHLGLDLLNRAGLVKTPFGGLARGTILFSGSYLDPGLGIDMAVEGGRIDTFVIDTLRMKADYANGRYAIDSLLVASPSGSLSLAGEVSGMPLREAGRHPAAALRNASVVVRSSCRNLDLVPLLSLAGIRVFSGGRLSGTLALTDSLAHPFVSFKGRINNLAVTSFTIPSVDCDVKVDRDELTVEGTLHASPGHEGSFHGAVPLVRERFLYSLDRARGLSFEINLPEGDLAELSAVTDLVAEGAGRYSGQIKVTGTVASPHLTGSLRLTNASFRISGMEEKYTQVNASVLLEDSLVTIAGLSGREGKKGTFNCTGRVSLRGWKPLEYHITLNANEFLLASLPNILAIVNGTLNVGTKVEGGKALPILTGSCVVREGELYYDLGSFSSTQEEGAVEEPSWLAAIDLKIPGNTWIRTPDARVELQGNVTLYHDAKGTYLRGEINIVRGWYIVYNNKFTITSGKLEFVTAGSFRPVVDVEAETKDAEGRTIYLTLQWHQDDLQPRLTLRHQDPGYSETDIWKMLGGGIVTAEGAQTGWAARSTAQSLAANYLERVLNSQMAGVTIELETGPSTSTVPGVTTGPGTEDYKDTRIAVGKYLSQGLYVKYKQGLSISSAREIEVEYRISNLFILRSQVIRYSETAIQGNSPRTSDEINVNLKLRWEF